MNKKLLLLCLALFNQSMLSSQAWRAAVAASRLATAATAGVAGWKAVQTYKQYEEVWPKEGNPCYEKASDVRAYLKKKRCLPDSN